MNRHRLGHLIVSLCLWLAGQGQSLAADLQQEEVTTTPVYADGVLYTASTETVSRRGHLRAIDVLDTFPKVLWDAADPVPPAGTGRTQPESVHPDNLYRTVFTNLNDFLLPLEAGQAERLQLILGSASVAEAELLLHAVRGRRGGTPELIAGTAEDPQRLWRHLCYGGGFDEQNTDTEVGAISGVREPCNTSMYHHYSIWFSFHFSISMKVT